MRGSQVLSPEGGNFFAGLCLSALIVLVVIFGGAVHEAFIPTAAMEVAACGVLIWCLFDVRLNRMSSSGLWLLLIIGAGVVVGAAQLITLPASLWTQLPGRQTIADGFRVLGIADASQPLSLQPDRTLYGLLRLLPAVAVFVLVAKLPWRILSSFLPWTFVGVAVASALLALAQMLAGHELMLFPYGVDTGRRAVGLFEVVNHQATLQLMALPFVGVLVSRLKGSFDAGDVYQAQIVTVIAALTLVVVAIVLSGSVAGYAMTIPVMVVSSFWLFGGNVNLKLVLAVMLVAASLGAIGYLVFSSSVSLGLGQTDLSDSPMGRRTLYRHSFEMVQAYFPWGSGLGSFENAFPAFEDPAITATGFSTHAHNEYLEIAAELGLAGCLVLIALLGWWGVMTVRAWRAQRENGGRLKQAASLAVGVVLVHSLVDFPVRTEAVSCLAAACMAVLASAPHGARDRGRMMAGAGDFKHRHVEF